MNTRHTMLTPSPEAWSSQMESHPALAANPLVAGWRWPLVQRRPLVTDPPHEIPLGLPLPPSHGERRIAITLPPDAIIATAPPPLLADCRAPAFWQGTIDALLALDPATRCFGSLAWQHLTGLAYLTPSSDLDLLWSLPPDLPGFLTRLTQIAATAPMAIDGEIAGVQWRELAAGEAFVAVKTATSVKLLSRADFVAGAST